MVGKKWFSVFYLVLLAGLIGFKPTAAQITAYPPHWFKGTQNPHLDLLLFKADSFKQVPDLSNAPGVKLVFSEVASNPQYAYFKVNLKGFTADNFTLEADGEELHYRLKQPAAHSPQPLNQGDALYLITPDRFANGNPENDHIEGFNEKKYGRAFPFGRHGGDIAGISSKLDYIENTGFTTLWISPLLENNEFKESYHGYAITNHYQIDARFGTNQDYKNLVTQLHKRNMKMVMDVVYNHFGSQHHLFLNPPDSSFFHFQPSFVKTNYRAVTVMDPHAAPSDLEQFTNGWFDHHMPDVNQKNPHMQQFLIQNSLWWIFEFGIDGFRIDTYAYPDQQFMSLLGQRIKQEFPNFFLFGEIWVHMPEIQSYFAAQNAYNPHNSYLDGVTDFQLKYAIKEALHQEQGWTSGVAKIYYRLAADYLYQNPQNLVTFIDNHDEARIFGELNQDTAKLKVALGLLYTMRGIPCTYYGTEILMKETKNHGVIREDFQGGWPKDSLNKFDKVGRTAREQAMYSHVQSLLQWRKQKPAITQGDFTHYIPENNVYVYFRHHAQDTVMVILNAHPSEKRTVDLTRFKSFWNPKATVTEALSKKVIQGKQIELAPMAIKIFELD